MRLKNSIEKWLFMIFSGQLTMAYAGVLHKAVESGDLSYIIAQLEAGVDVNERDSIGMTPLSEAAVNSSSEIFKALVERGADINAKDNFGRTVINFLYQNSDEELLSFIRTWSIKKQIKVTDPDDVKILDKYGDYKKDFQAGKESEHSCKPLDYYLVVKPVAGLSNRLRVLASSRIIAMLTGRKLVVDWDIIQNEMPAKWDELFSYPKITMFEQSSLASEGCPLDVITSVQRNDPTIKNLGGMNLVPESYLTNQIFNVPKPIIYFSTSRNFKPDQFQLPEEAYNRAYRQFYKDLRPPITAVKEIDEFQKKYFANKFPIGIHYRAWQAGPADYYVKSDPENRYLDDFIVAMNEALRTHPNAIFFLATDDPNVKEKMLKVENLKGKIVTRQVEIERSTIKGQLSALVDWFLLGSTNFIIGTKDSSFSDEAAHLTKEDRKISIGESAFYR